MKQTKHLLTTIAMLLCCLTTSAHDFEVGGIFYNITSSANKTVKVTFKGNSYNEYTGEYSGSITIPATVTYEGVNYSVTSIGSGAFWNCRSLTAITIPESVASIGESAFKNCYDLASITLPEGVTSIGEYAFSYCRSLTAITIPEGVTSIGEHAFYYCISLTAITIPESVTSIGSSAFLNCNSLTAVHISSIEAWCKISFNGSYSNPLYYAHNLYLNGELVTELVIPESVTSIGEYAFYYCRSLTSITLPEGVTSIGEDAFSYCRSLTAITIPESVTSIGSWAFSYCSSLTAIVVDKGNTVYDSRDNCNAIIKTRINQLVAGCSTTIIPASVTSIGDYAFYGCKFTSITIPEGVTSIGEDAFHGCSSLTAITLPESVTSIEDHAFYNCYSLTAITIPEGVTSIGDQTFDGCSSLTAINIPEGVTSIGERAFEYCSSLTSITIPEGVTSIGSWAFSYCRSLTAITLPESVTSIGSYVFSDCHSLTDVYCYAEEIPTTYSNAFEDLNIGNATLHVPASAMETYKTTAPWSSFGKFEILPPTSVTITVNQYGSGTYCSEYALDFSNVEGLKAYAATGYNSGTGVVTLVRVMTAKAGEGIFIKGEPGKYMVPIMESTLDNTLNMLVGTLAKTEVNATSDDGLYANYKYTIKEGDSQPLFYQFTDGSTFGAGKAYLQIPTAWLPATDEAKSISLRFEEGEGTTDMENSQFTIDNSQLTYDLYGRRVDNPVKGGIYIVGGRKVVY